MAARAVLVAGCGYVGSALAARLASAGHTVFGLTRSPRELPDGVRAIQADLTSTASLRAAVPSDVEQVVFAAAASGRTEDDYRSIYVEGLSNVLEVLAGRSVERALFTSSTAVYGQDDGEWVDEASPAEPTRFTGEVLLEAERRLASAPMATASLRLAGIYGPGRTWLVRRVFAREATLAPAGAPPIYGNRIHRDDCAGALAHLLALDALEPAYVGVDDDPAPLSDVHAFVAELLGVTLGEGPPGEGRGGNKRCRATALRASGWRPSVPGYRDGYPAIVEAWRREAGA
ncbi:MAG: NAD-dependent epimerase/dehydratase family protein [Sandaracinaceae bacterium]|nr:NAD-dependent epimerase/dehydratase family protein [Sandaracinaceae bacterium]